MLNFIIMTLSITVALVLASVIMCAIGFALVFNEKFFGWYMAKVQKVTLKVYEQSFDLDDKEETV